MRTRKILFLTIAAIIFAASAANSNAQTRRFSKTLKLQGVTFTITSPNTAKNNKVTIRTKGLTVKNTVFNEKADGVVIGAEVEDLNSDGSPEVYIYITSADKKGSLIAFSTNNKKSLSSINLPEMTSEEMSGYRGGDEFTLIENTLGRRFPLYDDNGKKTGKMRQIEYKLKQGEAMWQLEVNKVTDF